MTQSNRNTILKASYLPDKHYLKIQEIQMKSFPSCSCPWPCNTFKLYHLKLIMTKTCLQTHVSRIFMYILLMFYLHFLHFSILVLFLAFPPFYFSFFSFSSPWLEKRKGRASFIFISMCIMILYCLQGRNPLGAFQKNKTYLAEAMSWALWTPSSKSVWMMRILRVAVLVKQFLKKRGITQVISLS